MRITDRDRQIILAVHTHRLLSAPQIEALFFKSEKPRARKTSCQRRLQLLYHHGFLERIAQPIVLGEGRSPYIYALDSAGADLVASITGQDRADVGWKPTRNTVGFQFVSHTLAVNDFQVALECLDRDSGFGLRGWVDEAQFRSAELKERVPFRLRGARVTRNYPDGYFVLTMPGTDQGAHFFLEVDQGTMTNTRWQDKVKAYIEYRNRGLSEKHFGTRNFRLLAVTTSTRRMKNLKRATEKIGGDHYFWFTTEENVDIWQPERLLMPVWYAATKDENLPLFP